MKLSRKLLNKHERMANKYGYSRDNWVEVRNSTQLSKSKHPSQARQIHGENSSLEIRNNKRMGIKSRNGDN